MTEPSNIGSSTQSFDPKKEVMNFLLADAYFSIGYRELSDANSSIAAAKDIEQGIIAAKMFVGVFNLAHGFELLFKSLIQSLGQKASGKNHMLVTHYQNLKLYEPLILQNSTGFRLDDAEVTEMLRVLEKGYFDARYFGARTNGPKNQPVYIAFPSPKTVAMTYLVLATTFPIPLMRLSFFSSLPKQPVP